MSATETLDVEAVSPEEGKVEVDGVVCRVRRLQTREILQIVKILTRGLGPGIKDVTIDTDMLEQDVLALLILAVPNAIDEMFDLLTSVVEPVSNYDRAKFLAAMKNPPPETMLDVFEVIALQEKDDLHRLVGKVQAMTSRLKTAYQKAG